MAEEKNQVAYFKGEPVKMTTTDWIGATTRNDPDWSTRPPERKKPERDMDRINWERKRAERR